MTREADWTKGEFAVLITSHGLSDDEAAVEVGARSAGAVGVVREGICLYHKGRDVHGILSKMMLEYLEARQGQFVCARCGGYV